MLHDLILLGLGQLDTVELVAGYYVVIDAQVWKWVWALKHHTYFETHEDGVHLHYILVVEHDLTFGSCTGNELVHAVDATQESSFTTAGWAHNSNNIIAGYLNVHVFYYVILPEISIVIDRLYNCTFHFLVISFVKMFNVSTQISSIQDAPHARSCQSLYGLVA